MGIEIIVRGRSIEAKDSVPLLLGVEGWFTLEAVGRAGKTLRSHKWRDAASVGPFQNLILNQGLDNFALIGPAQFAKYFKLGTSTVPPSITDVDVLSRVGTSIDGDLSRTYGVAPNYEASLHVSGLSSVGAFGNNNLTEISIGGSVFGSAASRALIVDASGNPVAFPISSDEQLRASYELKLFPPLDDHHFTVDVSREREVVIRPLGLGSSSWGLSSNVNTPAAAIPIASGFYSGGLNDPTNNAPNGSLLNGTGSPDLVTHPYSPGSYRRGYRKTWGSTQGNSTEFRTDVLSHYCCKFQAEYNPPLEKNSDQSLYLEYELAWGRR